MRIHYIISRKFSDMAIRTDSYNLPLTDSSCNFDATIGMVSDMFHSMHLSLPWPDFDRTSMEIIPALITRTFEEERYLLFDVNDANHPFSNVFMASIPIANYVGKSVANFKLAIQAGEIFLLIFSREYMQRLMMRPTIFDIQYWRPMILMRRKGVLKV